MYTARECAIFKPVNASTIFIAGLSSGATSSLFYASQIANIPVIFTAEPDDMAILPGNP